MIKRVLLGALLALPVMGFADQVTNVTWKSSIALGATFKSGNTDKSLYTMDFKGERYAPKSDWINSLHGEYGLTRVETVDNTTIPATTTAEDEQTEGQLRGQSNYRYKFGSENFYGGVFSEGYHDAIKDINYRIKIGPNVGYYFIKDESMKLDGSVGINYVQESTSTGSEDYAEWRVAGNFLWDITKTANYYLNVEYSANLEDQKDGTGLLVTGLKSKLNGKLSMFVEMRDEYDNIPAADTERMDTTIIAGLTYDLL